MSSTDTTKPSPNDSSSEDTLGENYHPSYSAPDANLVLRSDDGVKFRVHTLILQLASETFEHMLSKATDNGDILQLSEQSNVLLLILNMVYPTGYVLELRDQTADFDFIWDVLLAAEKYGFKQVSEEFRVRISSDTYFTSRPIHSFVLSARFEWEEEIKWTSNRSLDLINTPASWKILGRLRNRNIFRLMKLPLERKEYFITQFKGILKINTKVCSTNLINAIELELFNRPSGERLGTGGEFWRRDHLVNTASSVDLQNAKRVCSEVFKDESLPGFIKLEDLH